MRVEGWRIPAAPEGLAIGRNTRRAGSYQEPVHWSNIIRIVALPPAYRWLAVLGWILYGLSWVTPNLNGSQIGAWAFLSSLTVGVQLTTQSGSPAATVAGLSLLLGWVTNFSMIIRWSVAVRFLWMVAPWVPYTVLLIKHGPAPSPVSLLYFYPWAVGIALVHLASIASGWAAARANGLLAGKD